MNYYDHARASGEMPPEFGMCARCKKRKEVDVVSMRGRILELCAKCQEELAKENEDPGEFPI